MAFVLNTSVIDLFECIENVVKDKISGEGEGGGGGGPRSSSFEHITKKYDIKSIPAIFLMSIFSIGKDVVKLFSCFLNDLIICFPEYFALRLYRD
jgi:hypothetical protein